MGPNELGRENDWQPALVELTVVQFPGKYQKYFPANWAIFPSVLRILDSSRNIAVSVPFIVTLPGTQYLLVLLINP